MAGRPCRPRSIMRTRPRHSIGSRSRRPSAGRCGAIACSGLPRANSAIRTAPCRSGLVTPLRARSRGASRPRRCAMACGRFGSTPEARPAASWPATSANRRLTPPPARSSAPSDPRRSARTPPTGTTACSGHGRLRLAATSSTRSAPASAHFSTRRCPSRRPRSSRSPVSRTAPRSACRRTRIRGGFRLRTMRRGFAALTASGSAANYSAWTPRSDSACSVRAASSWSRTSPASITPATAASTTTTCCFW